MVRPAIDLEQYKAQIDGQFLSRKNVAKIATNLEEEHSVKAHSPTVASCLGLGHSEE